MISNGNSFGNSADLAAYLGGKTTERETGLLARLRDPAERRP